MGTDGMLGRAGGAALIALALAWGGAAAAQDAEPVGEESPISGEGVDGEVTVTVVDEPTLPPGFCDDCEESGEFAGEVLAKASTPAEEVGGPRGSWADSARLSLVEQAPESNLCTSREFYVAWMCEWQGYPQP